MTNRILGLLAETSLHPGAGQAADVVDLPVSREGATGYPQIPETGLKGAMRQWAETKLSEADCRSIFGTPTVGAGELLISTARLLCLPVRRLDGPYAWVTCPHLLERLKRDVARTGIEMDVPVIDESDQPDNYLFVADGSTGTIFLEEYSFEAKPLTDSGKFKTLIEKLVANDTSVTDRLAGQIAVMSDREFSWFARNALPVDARNSLDASKMSENLWYEETLPPDSLFYALMLPRVMTDEAKARADGLFAALEQQGYLQVGGNETVGQGWMRVSICSEAAQ